MYGILRLFRTARLIFNKGAIRCCHGGFGKNGTAKFLGHNSLDCSFKMPVTVEVSDEDPLVDDKIQIVIRGLSSRQAVTVHAITEEKTLKFGSCACFNANEDGVVDLTRHESLSGTYTGVSAMGLFWSMKAAPGEKFGTRLIKSDASTPLYVHLRVCDGHISFEQLYTDTSPVLASLQFRRWYMGKGVRKVNVRSGRLRGALFLPPGPGPFLGVIDMFGAVGSLVEFRAALLASRGFAALALPYFYYEDLPKLLSDVELEYFLEAIQWLSDRPEVISGSIGMMGVSKGGEIALHASYYSPLVKAVVSINGAGFFSGGPMLYQGSFIGEGGELDMDKIVETEEGNIYRHFLVSDKENYIPIWEKDVKALLITGGDDQALDPVHLQSLHDCYPTHKKHNCRLLCYPKAGHLIEPPYSPHCRTTFRNIKGYDGVEGELLTLWGGSTVEHAEAQEDSWRNILDHFRTNLSSCANTQVESKL